MKKQVARNNSCSKTSYLLRVDCVLISAPPLARKVRVASSTRRSSTPGLQLQSTATSSLRAAFCVRLGHSGICIVALRNTGALLRSVSVIGGSAVAAAAATTALNADAEFDLSVESGRVSK